MEPEPPVGERETLALRRLQTAMLDAEAALASRMRMHPTDIAAMQFLTSADDAVGPTDLAHRLGLSPAATTELVDRLSAAGHVVRHRDLEDRRRVRLQASGDALDLVLQRVQPLITVLDDLAKRRTPEERTVIRNFLLDATRAYDRWSETPEEG